MKVQLISDTHSEFGIDPFNIIVPHADTLLWLGDISSRSHQSFADDVNKVAKGFKNVIIVLGNHDFYGYKIQPRIETLKTLVDDNVHILHRECVEIDGYTFVGATLWSDVKRGDPSMSLIVQDSISDFRRIKHDNKTAFTVADMIAEHDKDIAYIKHVVENKKDDLSKVVILTHFLPSLACVEDKWRGQALNYYFACSDLDDFIQDREMPWWLFGHSHSCTDIEINKTRIISNCFGYPSETVIGYDERCVIDLSKGNA